MPGVSVSLSVNIEVPVDIVPGILTFAPWLESTAQKGPFMCI